MVFHFTLFSRQWSPFSLLLYAAGGYSAVNVFLQHFYDIIPSAGPSMYPALQIRGESLLVSKFYKYGKGIKVGDMIVVKHPYFLHGLAGKRVLGMPGDFVLRDAPNETEKPEDVQMIQVPEGHVWLVGDNMPWSRDSREYGPLPMGLVVGKVIARAWPPWQIGIIRNTLQPVKYADELETSQTERK